jgi:hypothetical protein
MHKYYHINFSANKQNREAQTREQGGSAVLILASSGISWGGHETNENCCHKPKEAKFE